jgi:hypothetical protein
MKETRLYRKTLFDDHLTDDEEIKKFMEGLGEESAQKILVMKREVNWEINQAIENLNEKDIPYQLIVNNLLKQAAEISYWNFEGDEFYLWSYLKEEFADLIDKTAT